MSFASKPTPLVALPGGRAPQKDYPNHPSENSRIELLLLRISGADLTLLSRPECTHDKAKFVASGWLLILVGALAGISASFALFRIFHNLLAALLFGTFWGLFTFTIDRLLVVSTRKRRGFLLHSIMLSLPRLLLAGMLALTVSKPLELKIFESEIDFQLTLDATRDRLAHSREATESFPEITRLEAEKDSLQKKIDEARHNRDEAYQATMDEADGSAGHAQGLGPLYKAKTAFLATRAEELDGILTRSRVRLQEINHSLADLRAARDSVVSTVEGAQHKSRGILASLHALDEIAADPKSGRTLLIAIMFVNALFWVIDITPILTKLLTPYGVYDALLESRETAAMAHCSVGNSPKSPTSSFTNALTQRLEDETVHTSRLDKQVLEFEQELFARALAKLRGTAEFGVSEDEIGADVLARLRHRLGRFDN